MARSNITEIRKQELIDAVITAIHRNGFAKLTVNQIAAEAQTSTGSIHYYYGGKEALLEATMRHLLSLLKTATLAHKKGKTKPIDRLLAIVNANFDESFFKVDHCTVWTQFWAYAPFVDRLARLQNLNQQRVRSNLNFELREIVAPDTVDVTRKAIQLYMDGVWVHAAQQRQPVDTQIAQRDATQFIKLLIREANTNSKSSKP